MDPKADATTLPETATAIAAWLALGFSLFGLYWSRRAVRLAEKQDERRKPQIVLYLYDGYVRYGWKDNGRAYAFFVSVSNRSDTDNSLAEIELQLTCKISADDPVTIKIRSDPNVEDAFEDGGGPALTVPVRMDAHQTISGWCYFQIEEVVMKNITEIERHVVVIIDNHGVSASIEPIMVREFGSEIETQKMG